MSSRAVVGSNNPSNNNPQQISGAPTTTLPPGAANTQAFVQTVQLPPAPPQRASVGSNTQQIMSGAPNTKPGPNLFCPLVLTATRTNQAAQGNPNSGPNISGAPVKPNPNSPFSNNRK